MHRYDHFAGAAADEIVDPRSYAEECLRVHNRHARRDNKSRARIKILLHELGADEDSRQVEEEFALSQGQGLEAPLAEMERIKGFFELPEQLRQLASDRHPRESWSLTAIRREFEKETDLRRQDDKRFFELYRRICMEPFK